mgnify:CR=1 FL=1
MEDNKIIKDLQRQHKCISLLIVINTIILAINSLAITINFQIIKSMIEQLI